MVLRPDAVVRGRMTVEIVGRTTVVVNGGVKYRQSPADPATFCVDGATPTEMVLGSKKKGLVRVVAEWTPVNMCYSRDDPIGLYAETLVAGLDVNVSAELNADTTHFLKANKLSSKLTLALVKGLKVVHIGFLERIKDMSRDTNFGFNVYDRDVVGRVIPLKTSRLEYDFALAFPDYTEYMPEAEYAVNSKRASLFQTLLFIVTSETQYRNLRTVVESAGGRIVMYDFCSGSSDLSELQPHIEAFCQYSKQAAASDLLVLLKNVISTESFAEKCYYTVLRKAALQLGAPLITNKEFFESVKNVDVACLFSNRLEVERPLKRRRAVKVLDAASLMGLETANNVENIEEPSSDVNSTNKPSKSDSEFKRYRRKRVQASALDDLYGFSQSKPVPMANSEELKSDQVVGKDSSNNQEISGSKDLDNNNEFSTGKLSTNKMSNNKMPINKMPIDKISNNNELSVNEMPINKFPNNESSLDKTLVNITSSTIKEPSSHKIPSDEKKPSPYNEANNNSPKTKSQPQSTQSSSIAQRISLLEAVKKTKEEEDKKYKLEYGDNSQHNRSELTKEQVETVRNKLIIEEFDVNLSKREKQHKTNSNTISGYGDWSKRRNFKRFVKNLPSNSNESTIATRNGSSVYRAYVSFDTFDPVKDGLIYKHEEEDEDLVFQNQQQQPETVQNTPSQFKFTNGQSGLFVEDDSDDQQTIQNLYTKPVPTDSRPTLSSSDSDDEDVSTTVPKFRFSRN